MNEYHKIQTLFKRDMDNKGKMLEGEWTLPEFEFLANNVWVFTEKVDGTNIRVLINDYQKKGNQQDIVFRGKTDSAHIPAKLVERLQQRFHTDKAREKLANIFPNGNACLYGEGYGANIQKAGDNYRDDQDFVLFDVKVGDWWLQRKDVEDVAAKLGLDIVPIIGEGTLYDAISAASLGISSTWGWFQAEGIVARPKTELKTRNGQRIITKIKCRDFAQAINNGIKI